MAASHQRITDAELDWLEAHRSVPSAMRARQFVERFPESGRTAAHVTSICSYYARSARGHLFRWSEQRLLRWALRRHGYAGAAAMVTEAFGRQRTPDQVKRWARRYDVPRRVADGRYKKGNRPWTAGTAGLGVVRPNRGNFKPGHTPHNENPIGHERRDAKTGELQVKVDRPNPYTGAPGHYLPKARVWWEAVHGRPVPPGHVIRLLDGDETNATVAENLVCISRAEHGYLNRHASLAGLSRELARAEVARVRLYLAALSRERAA